MLLTLTRRTLKHGSYLVNHPQCRNTTSGRDPARIRNIGIVAHIDAGKTTVTERILYETGMVRSAGNIKHGTTTTDYLDCEQRRGITVNSAYVQALWRNTLINIIDTPGHIDFNFEVERALRVLDGSLIVLDGTRGVEAQTVTVWRQLDKFDIPSVIFVNKLDRDRRDLKACMVSISHCLSTVPIIVNQPVFDEHNQLVGVDTNFSRETLTDIVESLASLDEEMETLYFAHECDITKISWSEVMSCIVKLHKDKKVIPVCHGSGMTGIGIPSCLDAITSFLPSPDTIKSKLPPELRSSVCGVVFKSSLDHNKGVLCQSRLYSGELKARSRLFNPRTGTVAQASMIYAMNADVMTSLDLCEAGGIMMIAGCKEFRTGDVFVDASWGSNKEELSRLIESSCVLKSTMNFGEPLFFCTIECEDTRGQEMLQKSLNAMTFEDPTLHLRKNSFGEFELGGNGRLHLSIVRDRLESEYGLKCRVYKFRVNYFETVCGDIKHTYSDGFGDISVQISESHGENEVIVRRAGPQTRDLVRSTVTSCLAIGPLLGFQLTNCQVTISFRSDDFVNDEVLTLAVRQKLANLIRSGLKEALHNNLNLVVLSEPFAHVEVEGPAEFASIITSDFITRTGSSEYDLLDQPSQDWFHMMGTAPLSKLVDYVSLVRGLSRGQATVMRVEMTHYAAMEENESRDYARRLKLGEI